MERPVVDQDFARLKRGLLLRSNHGAGTLRRIEVAGKARQRAPLAFRPDQSTLSASAANTANAPSPNSTILTSRGLPACASKSAAVDDGEPALGHDALDPEAPGLRRADDAEDVARHRGQSIRTGGAARSPIDAPVARRRATAQSPRAPRPVVSSGPHGRRRGHAAGGERGAAVLVRPRPRPCPARRGPRARRPRARVRERHRGRLRRLHAHGHGRIDERDVERRPGHDQLVVVRDRRRERDPGIALRDRRRVRERLLRRRRSAAITRARAPARPAPGSSPGARTARAAARSTARPIRAASAP